MAILLLLLLLAALIAAAVIAFIVNKSAAASVETLLEPESLFEVVEKIDDTAFNDACDYFYHWAKSKRFEHDCFFMAYVNPDGTPMYCSVWRCRAARTWALLYFRQNQINIDFVTKYSDELGITTASSKDALTLPSPPTAYKQAFTNLSYDKLYLKHLMARATIEREGQAQPQALAANVLDEIQRAVSQQAEFITELPMWRLQGAYWYFIRRHLLANKFINLVSDDSANA